ncbi:unnamed protein product [Calypogeia fissa]
MLNLLAKLLLLCLTTTISLGSTPTNSSIWQPASGSGWQIVLNTTNIDTTVDVPIYDLDLFDIPNGTVASLHALGRKVICYFSAGSYEDWRPDASSFTPDDYKSSLRCGSVCVHEWWLNTNSTNVRNIMSKRLDLAVTKGCDGVDPDNIDAYDNDNGFNLTSADAVNYVTFLANEAHERRLSIGLKNGGDIVPQVLSLMQWEVNEQCEPNMECETFQPFLAAGKPVFHIEYPDSAPNVDLATKNATCGDETAAGFSTIMKEMDLGNWVLAC